MQDLSKTGDQCGKSLLVWADGIGGNCNKEVTNVDGKPSKLTDKKLQLIRNSPYVGSPHVVTVVKPIEVSKSVCEYGKPLLARLERWFQTKL